jgi:hypothetical protein
VQYRLSWAQAQRVHHVRKGVAMKGVSGGNVDVHSAEAEIAHRVFEHWIEQRHMEVQHYTSGFVVVADYVAHRDAFGLVRCYGARSIAQAEANRIMQLDPRACACAFDVERYKSMLDEQLAWVMEVVMQGRQPS